MPRAPYFLLALPERFYLWKDAPADAAAPPNYEVDAQQVLGPYLEHLKTPLKELSDISLKMLVSSWLHDLVYSSSNGAQKVNTEKWLTESGLYDAIKHGSLRVSACR